MSNKRCFKCGVVKQLSEYYKHKMMRDGHLNKCKDCTKNDVKIDYETKSAYPEFIESERKRGREKYRRLYIGTGRAKPECNARYAEKYPEKVMAKNSAQNINPPFTGLERHHWSYNKEHYKDVIWLSKKHHNKAHRFMVYDVDFKMYRKYDTGELLDTKLKHEIFIKFCIQHKED